ncbi:Mif2/CENP-C like-domain-containing protein [Mycena galopus ATCC 62051]|nr:Mif2/CENP-C like-domain-containing protein [Mycena galopus ATCC 62051]
MSRAAGEFMQTTAEVARHQAEEQAGQRVGQAMSGLFRSFTQVLGGANTVQADTATSAPWLPPACPVESQPKGGRACANESMSQAEREADVDAHNPEAGWDDHTDTTAEVLDYHSGKTVTRRVAFTTKMFSPAPAKEKGPDDAWSFEKIFGDGDFVAAGQLVIPEGKRKPRKSTKDNTNIFFVVEGAVNVMVHHTSFVLATGGMFMVPRGNRYSIENVGERSAKLFFTQARARARTRRLTPPRGVSVPMDAWTSATASVEESRYR